MLHIITSMRVPQKQYAIEQAVRRLTEILSVPIGAAEVSYEESVASVPVADAVVRVESHAFALCWSYSGALGQVAHVVDRIVVMREGSPDSPIPVLAVPFMGKSARRCCEQTGVSWLDLSGNAWITAPGIYINILGHKNLYRRPGRPNSAFSPRGSRVARWLLMNPGEVVLQRSLAASTGLNEGYVSRVVGRLIEMGLVERSVKGVRATDADRLLDAWRDEYRFDRHMRVRGHVTVGMGGRVDQILDRKLSDVGHRYAFTGLAAAWRMTHWAGHRLTTLYLGGMPTQDLLDSLGFRDEPRGANTWIVVPNDDAVFDSAATVDGIRCVHPLQAYLDLKDHPERAEEAAGELRRRLLQEGKP